MSAKWKKYSKEELLDMWNSSKSKAEFLDKMGYSKIGGGTRTVIKQIKEQYGFDDSHFLGQGWNAGNYNLDRIFAKNTMPSSSLLERLIDIRGHKCESCGNELWNDSLIPLHVHHKDGNRTNNELTNLLLLCPNCHALTK